MKNIRVYPVLFVLMAVAQLFSGCASNPNRNNNSLRDAIQTAVNNMEQNLQLSSLDIARGFADAAGGQTSQGFTPRPVVAVLSINSTSETLSAFIVEELIVAIAGSPQLTAVERSRLEVVRREQGFQHSGEVSDQTAQALGRLLGAQYVVTGDLVAIGNSYRIRVIAINVETTAISAASSLPINSRDETIRYLTNSQAGQQVVAGSIPARRGRVGEVATSGTGIRVAWIPAGTFTMGSPANEIGRNPGDEGQWQVSITRGFWMGVYPVTQEQWVRVMGSNPSGNQASNPVAGDVQGRRPVTGVSWYDSLVFANRLSIMEGLSPAYRINGSTNPDLWGPVPTSWNAVWMAVEIVSGSTGWRLPTDEQWEYAARAGTTSAFNNGTVNWESQGDLDKIGWFGFNSGGRSREVGLKQPNAWGLHDIHGNVWERVWDWTGAYPREAQTDPTGPSSGSLRVGRGGSWYHSAEYARSANRGNFNRFSRGNLIGLRLIRPQGR